MKSIRSLLTLVLLSSLIISIGCKKDGEENYFVTIDIITPENGTVLQKSEPFSVEVDYARAGDIIHNIKIEILNADGHSMMKLVERHVHEADNFKFTQDNIVIEQAGTYTLRALSTDMHMEGEHGEVHGEHGEEEHEKDKEDELNTVEISFTVR